MISCPRLVIAGLGGDTGKTVISVGLCRLWQKQGQKVVPFKKGPDYIDMQWLSCAARHPCFNLDLFLMGKEQVLSSVALNTGNAEIALIEGNRGLYDGMDMEGSVSTAEIAKLLQAPVILATDCTKVTRTVAALVLGCQMFDRKVPLKGVILNRVAGARHESIIRKSLEYYCGLAVVGSIPRLKNITFPGRHLGLVPPQEHPLSEEAIDNAANIMKEYLDLKHVWQISKDAPSLHFSPEEYPENGDKQLNVGIIRDSAFQFYYQENLDALKRAGARLIEFSAITDALPPSLDALYIGGGFPETHAPSLAANEKLRTSIKNAAEAGLPVYAECGGLMYLSQELLLEGKTYPMIGIFPAVVEVSKKPQGHGYTIIEVVESNPYYRKGKVLHGHEFHYSFISDMSDREGVSFAFSMKKGCGIIKGMDGIMYKNVLATYSHIHALGTKDWVDGIIVAAKAYKKKSLSSN